MFLAASFGLLCFGMWIAFRSLWSLYGRNWSVLELNLLRLNGIYHSAERNEVPTDLHFSGIFGLRKHVLLRLLIF